MAFYFKMHPERDASDFHGGSASLRGCIAIQGIETQINNKICFSITVAFSQQKTNLSSFSKIGELLFTCKKTKDFLVH